MEYVIGLDLGTSTCKALAISLQGEVIESASGQFKTHYPQPGWAEQDPEEIWNVAAGTIKKLVTNTTGRPLALGMSAAMHSLMLVDMKGEPITSASLWSDQRSVPQAARLHDQPFAEEIYERTGCPLTWVYYPARLDWWREEQTALFRKAYRFCGLKEWFLYRLTHEWGIDLGMASTTGLFDLDDYDWASDILQQILVHPLRLPEIFAMEDFIGQITPSAAVETGLPAGLLVAAGSSDGGLANLGAGAVDPGQEIITVGTSGAVRRIVAQPATHPLAQTWCYLLIPERYFIGGAINNAGLAVEWVNNRYYPETVAKSDFSLLMQDAEQISPGSDGLVFLPYFTGERSPHWNASLRGQIYGLGLHHTRAHIARAVLEGVAFCLADVRQALDGVSPPFYRAEGRPTLLTGSILLSPTWVQILADILGLPLNVADGPEASVFGAALCAIAALEDSPIEYIIRKLLKHKAVDQVIPDPQAHEQYQSIHARFQELFRQTYPPGR